MQKKAPFVAVVTGQQTIPLNIIYITVAKFFTSVCGGGEIFYTVTPEPGLSPGRLLGESPGSGVNAWH